MVKNTRQFIRHIITKEKNCITNNSGIAFIVVLIFIFVLMSVVLLFFFRNTIVSMREFRERERRLRSQYTKNAGFSMALSKIDAYYFSNNLWSNLKEPILAFQNNVEENRLDFNEFQFTLMAKDKPSSAKYKIIPPTDYIQNGLVKTYIYQINAQAWEDSKWSDESTKEIVVERVPLYYFLFLSNTDLEIFATKKLILDGPVYTSKNIFISSNDTIYFSSDIITGQQIYYGRKDRYLQRGMIYIWNGSEYQDFNYLFDSVSELEDFKAIDISDTLKGDGNSIPLDSWNEDLNFVKYASEKYGNKIKNKRTGARILPLPNENYISVDGPVYKKTGIILKVKEIIDSIYVEGHNEKRCVKYSSNKDGTGQCGYFSSDNPCCEYDSIFVMAQWNEKKRIGYDITNNEGRNLKVDNKPFSIKYFYDNSIRKTVGLVDIDIFKLQEQIPSPNKIYYLESQLNSKIDTIYSVLLTDGDVLASQLFFATDMGIYIKGNFNRHASGWGSPINPKGSETADDVWKPAIICGKYITLLSNNYQFKNTVLLTYNDIPKAGDSEYNFISITGYPKTFISDTGIVYGGGFEGIFRLLENWKGAKIFYWGSIITLWENSFDDNLIVKYYPFIEPPMFAIHYEPYFIKENIIPQEWLDIFPETTLNVRFRF